MPQRKVFTTKQAVEWLGMGRYAFAKCVQEGLIRKHVSSKANKWQFSRRELMRFAEEDTVRVTEPATNMDGQGERGKDEAEEADD